MSGRYEYVAIRPHKPDYNKAFQAFADDLFLRQAYWTLDRKQWPTLLCGVAWECLYCTREICWRKPTCREQRCQKRWYRDIFSAYSRARWQEQKPVGYGLRGRWDYARALDLIRDYLRSGGPWKGARMARICYRWDPDVVVVDYLRGLLLPFKYDQVRQWNALAREKGAQETGQAQCGPGAEEPERQEETGDRQGVTGVQAGAGDPQGVTGGRKADRRVAGGRLRTGSAAPEDPAQRRQRLSRLSLWVKHWRPTAARRERDPGDRRTVVLMDRGRVRRGCRGWLERIAYALGACGRGYAGLGERDPG